MKLNNKNEYLKSEYKCELTKELDTLAKLTDSKHYDFYYHYILADDWCNTTNKDLGEV